MKPACPICQDRGSIHFAVDTREPLDFPATAPSAFAQTVRHYDYPCPECRRDAPTLRVLLGNMKVISEVLRRDGVSDQVKRSAVIELVHQLIDNKLILFKTTEKDGITTVHAELVVGVPPPALQ